MANISGTSNGEVIVPMINNGVYLGGAGADTYILSGALIPANAVITITDTEGANKIQLTDGLIIASSTVYANMTRLTLSNGATVDITGAASFVYDVGANATASDTATAPNATYAAFASTLGVATLPTGSASSSGTANYTVPASGGGSTTPTVSISAPTAANEGSSGTSLMNFTVTLSAAQTTPVTVTYATGTTGTATAGTDFTAATGTLTFAAGTTTLTQTIPVTVNGDTTYESDETVIVTLSGQSSNVSLGTSFATGTIKNDDAAPAVLTTLGGDIVTATAAGQVITGIVDANNSVSTLNSGDIVSGGGFSNVILNVVQSTTYPGTATIKNLDTIFSMGTVGGGTTFVASGVDTVNNLISNQSTSAFIFSNVPSLSTSVGVKDSTQNLTANWLATLLTGSSDTAKISLENATGGAAQDVIFSNGIENIILTSNGSAANDIDQLEQTTVANDNFKALTILGNNSLRIRTALDDNVTTVDASGMTGTAGVRLGDGGSVVKYTGSNVGNDTFEFTGAAGRLTKDDVVDGKGQAAGGMDTVVARLGTDMSAAGPTLTGIENLTFFTTTSSSTLLSGAPDLAAISVLNFGDGTIATGTFLQVPAGVKNLVYIGDTNNAAQTFDNITLNYLNASGSSDSLALSFNNAGGKTITTGDLNLGNVTAAGVEVFTGTFSTALATLPTTHGTTNLDLDATSGTTFTFTSAGALNLTGSTLGTAGTAGLSGFNASGVAGGVSGATLNVATGGSSITLTGADDTVTISPTAAGAVVTSGVIVSAGAGADTITVTAGVVGSSVVVNGGDSADTLTGSAQIETLNGDAGNDNLVGAAGADVLYGGAGIDTITTGAAADDGADDVIYTAATDGAAAGVATGNDNIIGFDIVDVDLDQIGFGGTLRSTIDRNANNAINSNAGAAAAASNTVSAAADEMFILDGGANDGVAAADVTNGTVNLANIVAEFNSEFDFTLTGAGTYILVVNEVGVASDQGAVLLWVNNAGADDAMAVGEVILLGTIAAFTDSTGDEALLAANFTFV